MIFKTNIRILIGSSDAAGADFLFVLKQPWPAMKVVIRII